MSQRRTAVKVCIGAAVAGVLAWGGTTFLNRERTSRVIRDAAAAEPLSCEPWMNNNLAEFFTAVLVADDVSRCLKAGADIEARYDDGDRTPLHMAAELGSPAVVKALLDAGADIEAPNKYGETPLHMAADDIDGSRQAAVVRVLLDAGADIQSGPNSSNRLLLAILEGNHLMEAVFEEELKAAAYFGLTYESVVCQDVWNDSKYFTLLAVADVTRCLEAGADIQARSDDGWTPLHMAARWGSPAVVKALLDAGADIQARGDHGLTPLHIAAGGFINNWRWWVAPWTPPHIAVGVLSPAVAGVLLDAGADIEAPNEYGLTPLHIAAELGSPAVVKALLDAGADIQARSDDGWTPLHMAVRWRSPAVVKALLDAGADIEAPNEYGETPLQITETPRAHPAMKRLFKGLASN